jgi:hypothetical protein
MPVWVRSRPVTFGEVPWCCCYVLVPNFTALKSKYGLSKCSVRDHARLANSSRHLWCG